MHPKPVTAEELARVEDVANEVVLENDEVTTRLMAVDDAREADAALSAIEQTMEGA